MRPQKTNATGQARSLCLDWMPKAAQAIYRRLKSQRARGAFHELQLVPLCLAWGEARNYWQQARTEAGTVALIEMQRAVQLVERFARSLGISATARHQLVMQLYR